jgi:hypothetical protein
LNEVGDHPDDGLGQPNPSPTDEIVRRGKNAMERLQRGYEDWMNIAEALEVGRTESMRAAHTNAPQGKRYEKFMGEWLRSHSFHVIDKSTRTHLLECRKHRAEIDKWRATLTEADRFRFNHPHTVLRKWRAATVVPDVNAPRGKPSHVAKLKEAIAVLDEENYRMRREIERGGGDLWAPDDTPEDIATVMVGKLSLNKAERVARAILKKLNNKKNADVG